VTDSACKIAKVEPQFEKLNGADAEAYIISANIARRHMTAGQRAMVVAKMYPENDEQGRGKKGVAATHFPMVPASTLRHARFGSTLTDLSSRVSSLAADRRPGSTLARFGRKSERAWILSALSNPFLMRRLDGADDKSTLAPKPVVLRRCEGRMGMEIGRVISFHKVGNSGEAAGHLVQLSIRESDDSARFFHNNITPLIG
jgi:hypothetical protein